MNVAQLIEELKKMPPDMPVYNQDSGGNDRLNPVEGFAFITTYESQYTGHLFIEKYASKPEYLNATGVLIE